MIALAATLLSAGCGERTLDAPAKSDMTPRPASPAVAAPPPKGSAAIGIKAAMDKCYANEDAEVQDTCVRALENAQFALTDGRASRDGLNLCFKTNAPTPVCLEDRPARGMDSERDFTEYRYLGRLPGPPLYVVERWQYQGSDVTLIDADTGAVSEVGAVPVASPDGVRIAVASTVLDPSADESDQVIYRLASALTIFRYSNGKLLQEFKLEAPDDWGPGEPRWLDAQRLEVPIMQIIDASDHAVLQATGIRTYELRDGRWHEASAKPIPAN
ncbi:hypothetical protein V1318_15660 [Lysobacter sp. CCNWLW3]|uniref:hypothetical protein n=1 Tax=unclassified Lysobacter TaxID=2635362 RepID=UPI002FCF624A